MAKCGARNTTPPYGICRNPVSEVGERCYRHPGLPKGGPRPKSGRSRARRSSSRKRPWRLTPSPRPAAQPQPVLRRRQPRRRRRRPDNLTEREQKVVDRTVEFCVDIGFDGWEKTVAGRITDCLTPRTWNRLFRGRRRRDCKFLADLAKVILDGKRKLHEIIGRIGGGSPGSSVQSRLSTQWLGTCRHWQLRSPRAQVDQERVPCGAGDVASRRRRVVGGARC
jgi:hypothetical protein